MLPQSSASCSPKAWAPKSKLQLISPNTGNMFSFTMKVYSKGWGEISKATVTRQETTIKASSTKTIATTTSTTTKVALTTAEYSNTTAAMETSSVVPTTHNSSSPQGSNHSSNTKKPLISTAEMRCK